MSQALQDETPSSTRASLRFETTASSTASTSSSSSLAAGDTTRHDKKTHRFEAFQARLLPPKRRLLVRGAVLALVTAAEVPLDRDAREARDAAERERATLATRRGRWSSRTTSGARPTGRPRPRPSSRGNRTRRTRRGTRRRRCWIRFDWIRFDRSGANERASAMRIFDWRVTLHVSKRDVDTARKKEVLKKRRATRARGRAGSGQRACR